MNSWKEFYEAQAELMKRYTATYEQELRVYELNPGLSPEIKAKAKERYSQLAESYRIQANDYMKLAKEHK